MLRKIRVSKIGVAIPVGLGLSTLAQLLQRYHPASLPAGAVDLLAGLCFGLGLGVMLLALASGRARS